MIVFTIILAFIVGLVAGLYLKRDKDAWIHEPNGIDKKVDSIIDQWDKEERKKDRAERRKELYKKITSRSKVSK